VVQRLLSEDPALLSLNPWLTRSGTPGSVAPSRDAQAATGQSANARLVEELTIKEREVLRHLEELLTTEEIAERMFVSVNTVRTHVRSILRKLGVNRRNAAVRRARELGILKD
jgi:LuxR family maltose regulon positive regulatory protein